MAWSYERGQFGVCGNFRFKFYDVTDAANTSSVLISDMTHCQLVLATNKTDNADHFKPQTLAWSSTADGNTANELVDSAVTFVNELTGLPATNVDDGLNDGHVTFKDADEMYCFKNATGVAYDMFPDGNEAYTIYHENFIWLDPVTASDDGTVILIGK